MICKGCCVSDVGRGNVNGQKGGICCEGGLEAYEAAE